MRMMLRSSVRVEKGNAMVEDASIGTVIDAVMERIRPEAAYFLTAGRLPAVLLALLTAIAGPARGQAPDSLEVAGVVAAFHAALQAGDSAKAVSLLSDDARILESGSVETRAEYRAHHLPVDIAFAAAVASERTIEQVTVQGDVAWVVSTSETTGTYRDRAIDSAGAELVVLAREANAWKIRAIHWSSHARRRS